ncbi:MAG: hypothetical protein A2W98_13735 [Bacteroidetes bacterium GWF2_33_38]|nr:MAG: hypothetical protein A2W98_13735 [Bacteroidetes bacterium GWF2_33_38]
MKKIIFVVILSILLINTQAQNVFTVTQTSDPDPFLYSENPDNPEIQGTLQWAVRKANDSESACIINFAIQGTAPHVIELEYGLPSIRQTIIIDGTSQQGYQENIPAIIIDGQNKLVTAFQFYFTDNSEVKGLYIRNFLMYGIGFSNSNNLTIEKNTINNIYSYDTDIRVSVGLYFATCGNVNIYGNYIGNQLNFDENIHIENHGILINFGSTDFRIGDTEQGQANTISNVGETGIKLATQDDYGITISANKIYNNPIAISLLNGANEAKQAPTISSYDEAGVTGTSEPNDVIEIFGSARDENANEYLTSITADELGNWTTTLENTTWNGIVATATDESGNTSKLSNVFNSEIDYCLNNPINVGYETEDITCIDGNDGSITLSISGGYSPYSIIWETNPVQTSTNITNLIAGTYKFNITDLHGCTKHDSITLTEPYKQVQIYEDLILNYSSANLLSDVSNAVDKFDNLYVVGTTNDDVLVKKITLIKYNNSGIEQWIRDFTVNSELKKIIIDKQSNVIVIGTKTENNAKSIIATKYNQSGSILWNGLYNLANSDDEIIDAIADNDNNIVIAGNIDNYNKILIVKFDYLGNLLWATNYNDFSSKVNAIVADGSNIYLTGSSTNINEDFVTLCYSGNGTFLWSKLYNGSDNETDEAISIDIDNTSVYVTGKSFSTTNDYDIVTIKYLKNGTEQWIAKFNGVSNNVDIPCKIAVNQNIFITAKSNNGFNNSDFLTLCYDVNGQLNWGQIYNGASNDNDIPTDFRVTNSNIVVTGISTDFCTGSDYLTINYKTTGELDWVQRFSSEGNNPDIPNSISIDNNSNVFVSGLSTNKFGNFDITTVKYKNIETQCLSFPNKLKNKEDIQTENMSRNIFMLVNSFIYLAQSKELLNTVYNEAKKSEDFEVRYNTLIQKNPQFKTLVEKQLKNCFYADKPDIPEPYKDIESKLIYDNDLYVPNIYIPNINIADLNKLPIIAIGTSEVNDDDEIVGYTLSKDGQVKEILISEELANSSKIPIIIMNYSIKNEEEYIKSINDSGGIINNNKSNSYNIYLTQFSINYRYESNFRSDYHLRMIYFFSSGQYEDDTPNYLIKKINKREIGEVFYDMFPLSGVDYWNDLIGIAVATYEHDWWAGLKPVAVNSSQVPMSPCVVPCRMSYLNEWYQAFYFPFNELSYSCLSKGSCLIINL